MDFGVLGIGVREEMDGFLRERFAQENGTSFGFLSMSGVPDCNFPLVQNHFLNPPTDTLWKPLAI